MDCDQYTMLLSFWSTTVTPSSKTVSVSGKLYLCLVCFISCYTAAVARLRSACCSAWLRWGAK